MTSDQNPSPPGPRLAWPLNPAVGGADHRRTPDAPRRPPLAIPGLSNGNQRDLARAALSEAVAACALHLCTRNVAWHAINLALVASDRTTSDSDLLRQIAMVGSYGQEEAEAAMAAMDMLDVAVRAWAPYAHSIGIASGPWTEL